MPKIIKTAVIDTSPEKLIDYVGNAKNYPAFIPAIKSVDNIQGDPRKPGSTWDWTMQMMGVELKGKSERTVFEKGKRSAAKALAGIEGTITFTAKPHGNHSSELTVEINYEIPHTLSAKIADKSVLERSNQQTTEKALENLKTIFEQVSSET